jgi:arylsulfatase A-like enzyme
MADISPSPLESSALDHEAVVPSGDATSGDAGASDAGSSVAEPDALGAWSRFAVHAASAACAFVICKFAYLAFMGVNFLVAPWLIASDVCVGASLGLLAVWPRARRLVTDVVLVVYIASMQYAMMFGGFPGPDVFFYAGQAGGMQGSLLDIIRWPLLVLLAVSIVLHRFLERRLARRFTRDEVKARTLSLAVVSAATVLWLTPNLGRYYEYRQHPLSKLIQSSVSVIQLKTANGAPHEAAPFDYHSKFPSDTAPAPTLKKPARPMNVIMLSMESTGSISMKREGAVTTPFFDKLAEDGLTFDQFHAPVPFSIKSIFAYHSGHYPVANMQAITDARPRVPLKALPQYFKDHGYRTALLHGGKFSFTRKTDFLAGRGYDVMYDAESLPNRRRYEKVWWGIDDAAMFDHAKSFIKESGDPFYLQLIPVLVHHPYNHIKHWKRQYEGKSDMDRYHELIRYEDQLLERFVGFLKEEGVYEDTILVIYGDHGEAFEQHKGNSIHSGFVYEENVHVPLLVANPELFGRQGVSHKVGTLPDLYPTLLDIMGWKHDYYGPGVSLFRDDPHRMIFFYAGLGGDKIGLKDGPYKFIYTPKQELMELYDLTKDPGEQTNIAEQERARVQYYRKRAAEWQQHTYDLVHHQLSAKSKDVRGHEEIHVTDLPLTFSVQGWGALKYDLNVKGKAFRIAGKDYPVFGFGTHANSIMQFDVSRYQGAQFIARVGRDESSGEDHWSGRIRPEVWMDGEVVFRGDAISSTDAPLDVHVPVTGSTLSLVVHETGDGAGGDHADWLEPRLVILN